MFQLLVVFVHLVGTCLAIGTIVLTDARLMAQFMGYKVVIAPPSRFETRVIAIALLLQVASGAVLVLLHQADGGEIALNGKLQAKMLLVALLCTNAFVLHYLVFPRLERNVPLARWSGRRRTLVALSVALSNGLWLYCAFLGIARPWNESMSMGEVLAVALVVWLALAAVLRFMLTLAARDQPKAQADWIDSMKATLSGLGDLGGPERGLTEAHERTARPVRR